MLPLRCGLKVLITLLVVAVVSLAAVLVAHLLEKCEDDWETSMDTFNNGQERYLEKQCKIAIPTRSDSVKCQRDRKKGIFINRQFYKLTVAGEKHATRFPFASRIPFLDQTIDSVRYHTALDPIDSKWATLTRTFKKAVAKGARKYMKALPFNHTNDYKVTYNAHNEQINNLRAPNYFSNPANQR